MTALWEALVTLAWLAALLGGVVLLLWFLGR